MEVILIADVDNLGAAHEKVSVKNGYARNYLIPRKLAVEANPSNLKQLEERMKQIAKKEAKMMAEHAKLHQEMLSVLTAEQKAQLDQAKAQFKTRRGEMRKRDNQ